MKWERERNTPREVLNMAFVHVMENNVICKRETMKAHSCGNVFKSRRRRLLHAQSNSFGYLTRPQGYDMGDIDTNYWSDISCFL